MMAINTSQVRRPENMAVGNKYLRTCVKTSRHPQSNQLLRVRDLRRYWQDRFDGLLSLITLPLLAS